MRRTLTTTIGAAAATLYAVLLDRHKHRWEPYGTVIEVIVGELLCLIYFAARCPKHLTWREAVALAVEAQAVLGTPITLWRIYRAGTMLLSAIRQRQNG